MNESILVVEDDNSLRCNIDDILSGSGYRVIQAENGEDAINISKKDIPDLVISDIMMPVLDGYSLLKYFQSESLFENIPFIFLTAKSSEEDFRMGMNYGADDYIKKPFRAKDLLTTVQIRLNKKMKWQNNLCKIRESFALAVPHELRTPLIPILGYSDIIIDDFHKISKNEIYDMVKKIKKGGTRLHTRIEKFILLSSIRGELSDIERVKDLRKECTKSFDNLVNIRIKEIADTYDRLSDVKIDLKQKNIELKITGYHLSVIINELSDNSFKYSTPCTPVEINGKMSNSFYELSFSNSGTGMKQEQIKNINLFEQFQSNYQEKLGSGIGLYLVSEIIKAFEGKINIESELNNVTRISIKIPISINIGKNEVY